MRNISLKTIVWIGSSLNDLKEFPEDVQDIMGYGISHKQEENTNLLDLSKGLEVQKFEKLPMTVMGIPIELFTR